MSVENPEKRSGVNFIGGALIGVAIGSSHGLEATIAGAVIGGLAGEMLHRVINRDTQPRGSQRVVDSASHRLQ